MDLVTPPSPLAHGNNSGTRLPSGGIPRELEQELDLDIDMDSETPIPLRKDLKQNDVDIDSEEENGGPTIVDFNDNDKPPMTPLNPFGSNNLMESSSSYPLLFKMSNSYKRELNDVQEQRLINYLDGNLMEIQRLFVKYLSKDEDDAPSWGRLAHLIDDLIEFIWFSITGINGGINGNYHWNVYNYELITNEIKTPQKGELELSRNLKSNGCISFLITIMGEIITYIVKYSLSNYSDWLITLRLLGKIDDMISVFIDYHTLITVTEKVRINSLISRTKIVIVQLFERFSKQIQRSFDEEEDLSIEREQLDNFQIFMGEIYEGLIDRTSI